MNEEKSDVNVTPDLAIQQPLKGTAQQGHAGVVLRRRPPPLLTGSAQPGPANWSVERPRPLPTIVDTTDKPRLRPPLPLARPAATGTAHTTNVDTKDRGRSPFLNKAHPGPSGTVDSQDTHTGSGIVDTTDTGFQGMPSPPSDGIQPLDDAPPVPGAQRAGPDEVRLRSVVEARKKVLRDRAASRGRDPNAGAMVSPVSPHLTRSAKTHEGYLKTGERLMKRYRRSAELSHVPVDAIDPVDFVNFCYSIKPTITPSAWRSYKPGIRTMLDSLPHSRADEAIRLLDGDINENTTPKKETKPTDRKGRKLRRTSAVKEKKFPKDHFDTIVTYLRHFSRSKLAPIVIDWMVAGIATGLRPVDWAATDLEIKEDPSFHKGRFVWLYVLNAKATNGRANGLVRTLDLTHCTEDTIAAVRRMSERGYEWLKDGEYDDMQRQCAQVLYKACDTISTIKGKTYCLYSLRHQFVANQKSIHKPEYVAAMCGHNDVDTAISNYGKKTSAWAPEDIKEHVQPVEEEVALIQPRFVYFQQRAQREADAGLARPLPGMADD